jgi:hypothetical protein
MRSHAGSKGRAQRTEALVAHIYAVRTILSILVSMLSSRGRIIPASSSCWISARQTPFGSQSVWTKQTEQDRTEQDRTEQDNTGQNRSQAGKRPTMDGVSKREWTTTMSNKEHETQKHRRRHHHHTHGKQLRFPLMQRWMKSRAWLGQSINQSIRPHLAAFDLSLDLPLEGRAFLH